MRILPGVVLILAAVVAAEPVCKCGGEWEVCIDDIDAKVKNAQKTCVDKCAAAQSSTPAVACVKTALDKIDAGLRNIEACIDAALNVNNVTVWGCTLDGQAATEDISAEHGNSNTSDVDEFETKIKALLEPSGLATFGDCMDTCLFEQSKQEQPELTREQFDNMDDPHIALLNSCGKKFQCKVHVDYATLFKSMEKCVLSAPPPAGAPPPPVADNASAPPAPEEDGPEQDEFLAICQCAGKLAECKSVLNDLVGSNGAEEKRRKKRSVYTIF